MAQDYTDLDFASLRLRLLALATSAFPDVAWDAEAGLETLLLELHAFVGDVLAKYLNSAARESRWTTATQRRNLIALCKLIGYKPPGATAARAEETFTLTTAAAADCIFPVGTIIKTAEITSPAMFQLLAALTIQAGQTEATGTVENSATQADGFASSGLANQSVILAQTPYLDLSASVVAADGPYTEVENFLSSTATDKHFVVSVDQLDRARITFGNAVNGSIPSGTIQVAYKTGGGIAGNVSATKINRIEGSFTDLNGNPVRVSVSNALKSDGGTERASVAQIREQAPESIRVIERAVAREDFEIVARRVAGVARALCLTADEDPGIAENSGILFTVPTGGGTIGAPLAALVLSQFKQVTGYPAPATPMLNTFRLTVQSAGFLTVDISAKLWTRKGVTPATMAAEVRSRLTDFFGLTIRASRLVELAPDVASALGFRAGDQTIVKNPLVDFGYMIQDADGEPTGSFAWSDVFNLVRDSRGVAKLSPDADGLLINGARADLAIGNYQFPVLGTVLLFDAADGTAI